MSLIYQMIIFPEIQVYGFIMFSIGIDVAQLGEVRLFKYIGDMVPLNNRNYVIGSIVL